VTLLIKRKKDKGKNSRTAQDMHGGGREIEKKKKLFSVASELAY